MYPVHFMGQSVFTKPGLLHILMDGHSAVLSNEIKLERRLQTVEEKPIPNARLKNVREKRGWTRDYVAERIGSDPKSVGRWERGTTFPSPYYRQALCELFGMNAEELGFIKDDAHDNPEIYREKEKLQSEESNIAVEQGRPTTQSSSTYLILGYRGLLGLIVVSGIVIVLSALLFSLFAWRLFVPSLTQTSDRAVVAHIKPGGLWVNPANGQIDHSIIHFAAKAYPTNPGDPAINHVNFTVGWNGGGAWKVACIAYPPVTEDMFACDATPSRLGVPYGRIKVSFDVYDEKGNVNFAPNGVHAVVYSP